MPDDRGAFIVGLSGDVLTPEERALLRDARPCGLIIFTRNYRSPTQLAALSAASVDAIGGDTLVLVDQEGGRVQRLRGAPWPDVPPAAAFGALYRQAPTAGLAALESVCALVAARLRAVGVNTNCIPCLDLPTAGADAIIGDRAYGCEAGPVTELGRAAIRGCHAGGVLPVIKHVPGHGRAPADSHLALPLVSSSHAELARTDFAPFRDIARDPALTAAAMTAHVMYTELDAEYPASTSAKTVRDVIRDDIGFSGLLMSDDVSMQALSGTIAERADAVWRSGTDVVLHCNGDFSEMAAIARIAPRLQGLGRERFERSLAVTRNVPHADEATAMNAIAKVWALWRARTDAPDPSRALGG